MGKRYNLNEEEEGRLNQYVPQDTVFSYDGNLYIVNSSMNYNPYYHGLQDKRIRNGLCSG